MAKSKKKKIGEAVPQEQVCEMCGTKFVGTGGVCSTECADTWVLTFIDGPWNREVGQ